MKSAILQSSYHKALDLFGSGAAMEIGAHAEIYQRLITQVAAAEDHQRKQRYLQRLLFKSFSAKLVCLVRCLDQDTNKWTLDDVRTIAATLSPYLDCGEKITCWAEPKTSGIGWRPICSFGPKRQALHLLISEYLEARHGRDERDYLRPGKGAERASDWLVSMYENEDFPYFVLADIQNFFRSVHQGKIAKRLGLQEGVVTNALCIPNASTLFPIGGLPPDLSIPTLVGAAQEGLPQGSRASQIVAGLLLGPTLREISPAERFVFLGDDVALAASTKQEANALQKALVETLASHPAGPFCLKHCTVEHVSRPFDFLQYRHKRDWFTGEMHRRPAARSYARYERRIEGYFVKFKVRDAIRLAARYRRHWVRSFRRWKYNWLSKLALWQATERAKDAGLAVTKKMANPKPVA
jgi:hypothetical protein